MCATEIPLDIALRNIRIHSRLLNAFNSLAYLRKCLFWSRFDILKKMKLENKRVYTIFTLARKGPTLYDIGDNAVML